MFSLMKRQVKKQMMRNLSYQMRHQKRPLYTKTEFRKFIPFRGDKVNQLIEMMQQITISLQENRRFAHWLDEEVWLFHFDFVIGNMPPNYELVIKNSLSDLILYNEKKDNDISRQNIRLLKGVEEYIEQILAKDDKKYRFLFAVSLFPKNEIRKSRMLRGSLAADFVLVFLDVAIRSSPCWLRTHGLYTG